MANAWKLVCNILDTFPDGDRDVLVLWTDGLGIRHNTFLGKAYQVRHLDEIYHYTTQVVIILGPPSAELVTAMGSIVPVYTSLDRRVQIFLAEADSPMP